MKAVIMAGGKGTRLASITKDIPKPMVELCGKPILEHQINNLRECGITEIFIVVGYLGAVIEKYFEDGNEYGININYIREEFALGTAGALYFLREYITDDFILLFGDIFISIDFSKMVQFHKMKSALITLLVHPNSHPYDSDLVEIDAYEKVSGWVYKNLEREKDYNNLVNSGVYIVSNQVLGEINEIKKLDFEKELIVPMIQKKLNVYAYKSTEYVKDIGTPERYYSAQEDLENGTCESRNLRNKQRCIFLDRDGTINEHNGFINNSSMFTLIEGASEAIKKINKSRYLCIVITNQPVIARGECTYDGLKQIHNKMDNILGDEGAYIDDLFYCPHHPEKGHYGEVSELKIDCDCRKPKIGLIKQAAKQYNIDLKESWMIGDTTIDIQTGINASMRTALVDTGEGGLDGKYIVKADIKGENLLDCVNKILERGI